MWVAVLGLGALFAGAKGLGAVLPISVVAANVPQLWVAYKEGDLADLSLGTWLLSMSDGLVWGIYTCFRVDLSIRVFAILQLTTSGLIVALKLAKGRKVRILFRDVPRIVSPKGTSGKSG